MTDTAKSVDFIKARIGGQDFSCRIDRYDLPRFELKHGSALALFNKVRAGNWTQTDILRIVEFSVAPPVAQSATSGLAAAMGQLAQYRRDLAVPRPSPEPSAVAVAFKANGPGTYVPLALMILTAALFGVPEAEAHFSDA